MWLLKSNLDVLDCFRCITFRSSTFSGLEEVTAKLPFVKADSIASIEKLVMVIKYVF